MATPSFLEEYRPTELPNSGVKKPSFIEEYRPPSGPMHRGRPVNRQATDIAFPKTWDEYNQTGKPLSVLGMDTPIRLQEGVTEEGHKRTYFVPPPINIKTGNAPVDVGLGAQQSMSNIGVGGTLEAGRATLALGEYLLESVGLDDREVQYIEENFPTLPAGNDYEKFGQEVVSMLVGGVAGGRLVQKLAERLKTPEKAAEILSTFSKRLRNDPNGIRKLQLMVRGVLTEFGEILGASTTTPPEIDPLSEDLGIVPEGENNFAANVVDNTAFSVILRTVGKVLGFGGKKLDEKILQGFRGADRNLAALHWLKAIDPLTAENLPGEEIRRRAQIMADVIQKHKMFELSLTGNQLPVDTSMSIMAGAEEYMRRTYSYMEAELGAQGFADFVKQGVKNIITQTTSIKQGMKANPEVAVSDSNFLENVGTEINSVADSLATPAQGHQVAQNIGRSAVDRINAADANVNAAREQVRGADLNVDFTQSEQQITQMLEQARQSGNLGSSETQRYMLQNLTGPQLYQAWLKARTRVDDAFKNVPHEQVDSMELANLLARAGDVTNILEDFGIPATSGGLKKYDPTNINQDTGLNEVEELAQQLESKGYNDVYILVNELRSKLSRRINSAYVSGDSDTALQIELVRDGIDELINKSGNPDIQRAMREYKEYADNWLQTTPLKQYDAAASQVKDMGDGYTRGSLEANEAGMAALAQSRNAYTDDYLTKFVLALQSGNPNASPQISQALVGEALNTLVKKTRAGSRISSDELLAAIEPYARTLETTDPNTIKMWRESVEELKLAESGLQDAEQALANAEIAATQIREEAGRSAARYFIAERTGNASIRESSTDAFRQLFDSQDSPTLVKRLLDEMNVAGDELAIQGVKSEYLRWLKNRIFTKKPVGFTGEADDSVVRDLSGAKLQDALSSDYSHDMMLLKEVFADDPDAGNAVVALMTQMHNMINSRATKVNPFGSNTVVDATLQKSVNTLIMLTLGVLNPTATKARALTGALTLGHNARLSSAFDTIFGKIVTDPQFVSEALESVAKGRPVGRFLAVLTKGMARGTLGAKRDTEEQTEEAFNTSQLEQERETLATQHTERPVERVATNLPEGYAMDERGFIQRPGAIRTK
jgi:hypothetical protein